MESNVGEHVHIFCDRKIRISVVWAVKLVPVEGYGVRREEKEGRKRREQKEGKAEGKKRKGKKK